MPKRWKGRVTSMSTFSLLATSPSRSWGTPASNSPSIACTASCRASHSRIRFLVALLGLFAAACNARSAPSVAHSNIGASMQWDTAGVGSQKHCCWPLFGFGTSSNSNLMKPPGCSSHSQASEVQQNL